MHSMLNSSLSVERNEEEAIADAAAYIESKLAGRQPKLGMILGSGLGDLANELEDAVTIPYADVPHFPQSTVAGHAGQFVVGRWEECDVIVMQGRFHFYEGYAMSTVVLPVYVMKQLGIHTLVITNAAGGMKRGFQAGDLMLITDHLNMTGDNPLVGPNRASFGVRFPDMSEAYDRSYIALVKQLAENLPVHDNDRLCLQEGVYCGISGPSYMTPAELTMLAKLGGDAVGMSTVGEVIAARHCGITVLGVSCITDMAIGESLAPLTHEEVMKVANHSKSKLVALVRSFVQAWNRLY